MDFRTLVDTSRLRRDRYERLAREVGLRPGDRILELGCGRGSGSIAQFERTHEIVGIDLLAPAQMRIDQPNFTYRQADATDLSIFPDNSFDVAISVGMLEHVMPMEALERAIHEAQRVAHRYGFVVPHRYAFIEPHYQVPLFPIWPDWLKSFVIRRMGLGTQRRRRDGDWRRMNWLSGAEWARLCGDANLRQHGHWYGPLLMYRIIVGGERPPSA